jgi:hypothetical protein
VAAILRGGHLVEGRARFMIVEKDKMWSILDIPPLYLFFLEIRYSTALSLTSNVFGCLSRSGLGPFPEFAEKLRAAAGMYLLLIVLFVRLFSHTDKIVGFCSFGRCTKRLLHAGQPRSSQERQNIYPPSIVSPTTTPTQMSFSSPPKANLAQRFAFWTCHTSMIQLYHTFCEIDPKMSLRFYLLLVRKFIVH